ncbi:MAG: CoA-binding protein [Promethearchaeota archaeon]
MEPDTNNALDILFHPRNIVIYKASKKLDYFLMGLREHGFEKDKLYLVNPEVEEVFGLKTIKSLDEIKENVIDLLILAVSRNVIIETLKNLIEQKTIKTIHIFTAGLGESDDLGKKLENKLMNILHSDDHNIRAIGPNCMGVYSPKGHIAYEPFLPIEPGNISFVFQSGDLHSQTIRIASRRYNLKFSKGASVGNCVDLQISEFLNYFNEDVDTDIIGVYFEGFSKLHPNEGKRFLRALKKMNKPVLFMNGGNTERAQTAVLTHTGSIGSNKKIWDAIIKQTPIIDVPTSMDDMIDYLYMFNSYFKKFKKKSKDLNEINYPKGKNILLILWSGGFGIIDTNTLTELGLDIPYFAGEQLEKLRKIYPVKIGSLNNPLDMPWISSSQTYIEVTKTAISENIDVVMIETDTFGDFDEENPSSYYKNLLLIKEYTESLGKILILVLPEYPGKIREKFFTKLSKDGFIVYPSVRRAGRAFLALYEYGKKISKLDIKK